MSVPNSAFLFQLFWFYRADRITESHTEADDTLNVVSKLESDTRIGQNKTELRLFPWWRRSRKGGNPRADPGFLIRGPRRAPKARYRSIAGAQGYGLGRGCPLPNGERPGRIFKFSQKIF